jgi:TonB family protein
MTKLYLIVASLVIFAGCSTTPGPESPPLFGKLAPIDPEHQIGDAFPQVIKKVEAEYPFKYIGRVGGRAVIEFFVEKDGTVQRARIKSQTDPLFGDAASAAIKQWRFKPAQKAGVPVAFAMEIPFEFDPASGD